MAEVRKARSNVRGEKTRDPRSVKKFLEELFWVLNSNSNIDFRAVSDSFDVVDRVLGRAGGRLSPHISKNPNIHFLIGVLPGIFSNERLFPSNDDIVEFASEALKLSISRAEKRSRYELIGLIVCETAKSDDDRLTRLVDLLAKLVSGDENAQELVRGRKEKKLSWNEIIQRISRGDVV